MLGSLTTTDTELRPDKRKSIAAITCFLTDLADTTNTESLHETIRNHRPFEFAFGNLRHRADKLVPYSLRRHSLIRGCVSSRSGRDRRMGVGFWNDCDKSNASGHCFHVQLRRRSYGDDPIGVDKRRFSRSIPGHGRACRNERLSPRLGEVAGRRRNKFCRGVSRSSPSFSIRSRDAACEFCRLSLLRSGDIVLGGTHTGFVSDELANKNLVRNRSFRCRRRFPPRIFYGCRATAPLVRPMKLTPIRGC